MLKVLFRRKFVLIFVLGMYDHKTFKKYSIQREPPGVELEPPKGIVNQDRFARVMTPA